MIAARSTRSGIMNRPLQRLHAADGAPQNQAQAADAKRVEQLRLGPDVVANRDQWKVRTVDKARFGIDGARSG